MQMEPLVVAPSVSDSLHLFIAEAIATGAERAPLTSTGVTAQPATADATDEDGDMLTAIIQFNLTQGSMNYVAHTAVPGELRFRGAMRFLRQLQQLAVLGTEVQDNSASEAISSSLFVYNISQNASISLVRSAAPVP
jgi:collagenase-like PrtC family protease